MTDSEKFHSPEYQELASQIGQDAIDGDGEEYHDMLNDSNLYDLFEQLQELHSGSVTDVGTLLGVLDALVDSYVDKQLANTFQENDYDY